MTTSGHQERNCGLKSWVQIQVKENVVPLVLTQDARGVILCTRCQRCRQGEKWGEVSPHHLTGGIGSVICSPSRAQCTALAENHFSVLRLCWPLL